MAALLFANMTPSAKKTTLIGVFESSHRFSRREQKKQWLLSGGDEREWNYHFSVIYITDKTKADLLHLMVEGDAGRAYTFSEPPYDSEVWRALRDKGEAYMTYADAEAFINGR